MKVLFLKHVVNVGKQGDIKDVKPGYASNLLIPKGFAIELTPKLEKELKTKRRKEEKKKTELLENRFELSKTLNLQKLEFKLKAGENNKVYGAIGEKDIIKEVKKSFKIDLSKKHIDMPDGHIKKLGESIVYIRFGKDAISKVFIVLNKD